jgi:DNA-binding transcriptional ArsR family regulator
MQWATAQDSVKATRKLVLVLLADACNQTPGDRCFMRISKLARVAGISAQQVGVHLKELDDAGLIERKAKYREDGARMASEFVLQLDQGAPPATPERATPATAEDPSPAEQDTAPKPTGEQQHNNNNKKNNKGDENAPDPIWNYWLDKRQPKRTELTDATRRFLARARNAGYGDDELKRAIDGLLASDFHRERKLLNLSTIFATKPGGKTFEDQIDYWIERAPDTRPLGASETQIENWKQDVRRAVRLPDDADAQLLYQPAVAALRSVGIEVGDRDGRPTFQVRR